MPRRPLRRSLLTCCLTALGWLGSGQQLQAGCAPAPTTAADTLTCNAATAPEPTAATINTLAGDDRVTVDSGSYTGGFDGGAGNDRFTLNGGSIGSITDTAGSNTLILPAGSTATVTGAVTFGVGSDRLEVHSGSINGQVQQGDGADTFIMTGGQVQALNQGGGLDTASVSGGRIVGLFFAGDFFTMTGGRIGEVNLEQANNEMRMSGGTIDGNVSAAQNNDLLELSGGSIGGTVNFGSGNNRFVVTGGSIGGQVLSAGGTDSFTWDGGGTIGGAIDLGAGNDTGALRNLTTAILSATPLIDGDLGTDGLTFDNTVATGVGRIQRWETVALTNGTRLTLDQNLVLGDSGTGTGSLGIDGTSTLLAGGKNLSVLAFTGGQPVNVTNNGTIDLTNGGNSASDSLTIVGNYTAGSRLLLNSVLGADGSPSDKLVISGGAATGSTAIGVVNVGGPGAQTTSDGILVVEATNGGTTAASAFSLGDRVAAGAHEYLLFRGGVSGTAGADNWYLRSTLAPGSAAAAPSAVAPLPPDPPPLGALAVQLFRPEVPLYSAVPPMGRELALATLGTFHERQGAQSLLKGTGVATAGWGRLFGGHDEQTWSGTVDPAFDGWVTGLQAGLDLASFVSPRGDDRDRLGVFFGYARADGDVDGLAVGRDRRVGDLNLNAYSLGGYWTHLGAGDWYLDAVLMGTFFDGDASSDFGTSADADGTGVTASLEGGYPIPLGSALTLEPQVQLIWQHVDLDDTSDAFSAVDYDTADSFVGRAGGRLQADFRAGSIPLQPYLKLNLWQQVGNDDAVTFAGTDTVSTKQRTTAIEAGVGVVAQVGESIGLYAVADYTTDIAGNDTEIIEGNVGVRVTW